MRNKSVVFLLSVLIGGAALCLALTSIVSSTLSAQLLGNIVDKTQSSIDQYQKVVRSKDKISELNFEVVSLIGEKDIDKLEGRLVNFNASRIGAHQTLSDCKLCEPTLEFFKIYESKLDKIINEKIMTGKTAEATEFFLTDLNTSYNKLHYCPVRSGA